MMSTTYVKTKLPSIISITDIVTIHYFEFDRNFSYPGESHDFWEMVYSDGGTIICSADGKELALTQGQAILHPPMEEHNIVALGSDGNACIISFCCEDLNPDLFKGNVLVFSKQQSDYFKIIFNEGMKLFEPPYNALIQSKLKTRESAPFGAEQILRNALESLLVLLIRDLLSVEPDVQEGESVNHSPNYRRTFIDVDEVTNKVIDYMMQSIGRSLTVKEICKAVSFSDGYLQRIFQKQTGQSLIHYFNMLKIEQAKKMISEGKYSLTQIGGALGFSSIHYFSRVFKSFEHLSPKEYADSVRRKAVL